MEASSPLAAMHRPTAVPTWGKRDIFRSHAQAHLSTGNGGAGTLGLREQLHKSNPEYFNVKDVRGSSPAASLAADLSQNFRLDNEASPRFPTPRRALFTANVMGAADVREYVTTPPLPSSSPGPMHDVMEVSPLPHKASFCITQIDVTSPTPTQTPEDEDEMMLDSPAPISRQLSLEVPRPAMAERRKSTFRRPSLTRTKGYSTGGIINRGTENQLPVFRFGGDSRLRETSSALSLGECFETESPPQERRPQTANSPAVIAPAALRSKPHFSSISGACGSRSGSPFSGHARRPSNPFLRPRKQYRRSLSMFEHPGDIMKPKTEMEVSTQPAQPSVMDIQEDHEPTLPHFFATDPMDSIPRISKETLVEVLDGKYAEHYDQKMVVDCRFEYEYEGGHIDGAINYNNKELLSTQLFRTPMGGRTLLIFHCEYSAHRAPLMARHIRSEDRTMNAEHYPKLTYPEIYILDGGYSAFFAEHRCRCYPQNYVEMNDAKHARTCERELGRLKNRKGLGRAQTFHYGARGTCVDDSPTAPGRPNARQSPIAMIGNSPILGERSHARRMASY